MSFLPFTPQSGHPRFWTNSASTITTRRLTTHAAYWADLRSYADSHLSASNYPFSYFTAREGINTGALAFYWLGDQTRTSHAHRAIDIALYICGLNIPSGFEKRNFISALAMVYDWAFPLLTSTEKAKIRTRIADYVLVMKDVRDSEYTWGVSHGNVTYAAAALTVILGDGTASENTKWSGWMGQMMDSFDNGTNSDCFWPIFEYFSNGQGGTHKGSGPTSYYARNEEFYYHLLPALDTAVGFDWFTRPETAWWEDEIHWALWHLRMGDSSTVSQHRQHECRGIHRFMIQAQAHAIQVAQRQSGTLGRQAQWLADLIDDAGETSIEGPNQVFNMVWRETARVPLQPTIANTGGSQTKHFARAGKICLRSPASTGGAWDPNAITGTVSAPDFTNGHQQRDAGAFNLAGYGEKLFFMHGHYDADTDRVPFVSTSGANTGHRWTYYARVCAQNSTSIRSSREFSQNAIDSTRRQITASSTFGIETSSGINFSNVGDLLWPKNTARNDYFPNDLQEFLGEQKWSNHKGVIFEDTASADFEYFVIDLADWYWSGKCTKFRQHVAWIHAGQIPGWSHGSIMVMWFDMTIVTDAAYGKKQVKLLRQTSNQMTGSANDLRLDVGGARAWMVTSGPTMEVTHVSGFKDFEGFTYPRTSSDDFDDSNDGVWRAELNPAAVTSTPSIVQVFFVGPSGTASHPAVTDIDDATWRGATIGGVEVKFRKGTTFQISVAGSTGGSGSTGSTTSTISTTTRSTTTVSTLSTTSPSGIQGEILGQLPAVMPQRNPTNDKPAARLSLAGSSDISPILSGLATSMGLILGDGEELHRWRIFTEEGFEKELTFILAPDQDDFGEAEIPEAKTTIVFGVDTATGPTSIRNYVEWETNFGKTRRQFWVRDLPTSGALYCGNQECQSGFATFQVRPGEDLSFGIAILPEWSDEFFNGGEFEGNRYANTLRMWGGAATAEVFIDGIRAIGERDVAEVAGFFWTQPSLGEHSIVVRLRAARKSIYKVDIEGTIVIEGL